MSQSERQVPADHRPTLEAAVNGEDEMTFYNPENKVAEWVTSDTVIEVME